MEALLCVRIHLYSPGQKPYQLLILTEIYD